MSLQQVCDLTVRMNPVWMILMIETRRKPASCWSSLVFFRISQNVKIVQPQKKPDLDGRRDDSTRTRTFFAAALREESCQIIVQPRPFLTVHLKKLPIQQKVEKQLVLGEEFLFWPNGGWVIGDPHTTRSF